MVARHPSCSVNSYDVDALPGRLLLRERRWQQSPKAHGYANRPALAAAIATAVARAAVTSARSQ